MVLSFMLRELILWTRHRYLTSVYAVGDVRTKLLRQIVTAVADGAMAVHMAEKYMDLTVAMSKPYLPC